LEPDPVTYAILLTHFSRAADWDKVDSLLEEMHGKGMAARTPIYAGYIRHLCQALNWNRALSLYLIMQELGAEVTAPIYSELLQVGWGDAHRARAS
jgi:pentatricopeptide repeat protein